MGIFQLPDIYHSDFQSPRVKPFYAVRIKKRHPLTKFLAGCFVLQNDIAIDLVDGSKLTNVNGVTTKGTPEGLEYEFDGVDQRLDAGDKDRYSFGAGEMSIFVKGSFISDASDHTIVSKYFDNSPFVGEYHLFLNTNDTMGFQVLDGNAAIRCFRTSTSAVTNSGTYGATWDASGVDEGVIMYNNGLAIASTGQGQDASYVQMENTTAPLLLGAGLTGSPFASFLTGQLNVFYLFKDKVLSAVENISLDNKPYQLLELVISPQLPISEAVVAAGDLLLTNRSIANYQGMRQ